MKIMSYNILHGEGLDGIVNLERTCSVINAQSPDIVLLQEIDVATRRIKGTDSLKVFQAKTGMIPQFAKSIDFAGGEYGIGILSKEEPISIQKKPLPGNEPRMLLCAEFEKIIILATHLCLTEENQLASLPIIKEIINKYNQETNKPIVIGGDFNFYPGTASYNAYAEILDWDPDAIEPTCPSDVPDKRIDHIVAVKPTHKLINLTTPIVINEPVASDHRPVITTATFK